MLDPIGNTSFATDTKLNIREQQREQKLLENNQKSQELVKAHNRVYLAEQILQQNAELQQYKYDQFAASVKEQREQGVILNLEI